MSLINSLKRLERVGSENSRCTEKLREAVREVADIICDQIEVPAYPIELLDLPRNYQLTYRKTLCSPGGYQDFQMDEKPDRIACLNFAHDVATGWLDEISDFIQARIEKEKKAVEKLETAKEKL